MEKEPEEEGLIGQICKSRQYNNHDAGSFKLQSVLWLCFFMAKLSANVLEIKANSLRLCSDIRVAEA